MEDGIDDVIDKLCEIFYDENISQDLINEV